MIFEKLPKTKIAPPPNMFLPSSPKDTLFLRNVDSVMFTKLPVAYIAPPSTIAEFISNLDFVKTVELPIRATAPPLEVESPLPTALLSLHVILYI